MSILSHILPPPKYLTMPSVGVDISDASLKYMSFESGRGNKGPQVDQWGDLSIPTGVVDRGLIKDAEQLTAVLREFKLRTGAEAVRVSLPEERAYLFETDIRRNTPLKEVRGLLEFRLEENVPIPSKDVFFDYHVLPSTPENRTVQVAVAAYPKDTIQQYYDVCLAAGLLPVSFEVEAQAMARAVIPSDVNGAVLLVDFGKTRTGIGIAYQGVLLYTSTIDIGGDLLSKHLRKVVGAETAESELTELKNTQGLVRTIESATVREALLSAVSVIKDELATRMQYWHLRNGNSDARRISSVFMCGGSANLKGLPTYLTDSLGVPCVRGNVWENALSLTDTVPPIDRLHSYGYAIAIGLALRQKT